ncbi:hypothetical protein L9F63_009220, partial [Diploptera punctata]
TVSLTRTDKEFRSSHPVNKSLQKIANIWETRQGTRKNMKMREETESNLNRPVRHIIGKYGRKLQESCNTCTACLQRISKKSAFDTLSYVPHSARPLIQFVDNLHPTISKIH